MSNTPTIRLGNIVDTQASQRFLTSMHAEMLAPVFQHDGALTLDALCAHERSAFFLACVDEDVIGLANVHGHAAPQRAHAAQLGMSVHADWRSRGVGSLLLDALLAWAPEHGLKRLELEVLANNPGARALFRRAGFVEEGRRRGAVLVDGHPVDVIEMAHDILSSAHTACTPGLERFFHGMDVYLFDQLARGNITAGQTVLDAGCGAGRNLIPLWRAGFDVTGVDRDAARIDALRERLEPWFPEDQLRVAGLEHLPWRDGCFDVVACNAVLHFSGTPEAFTRCLDELWRVLASGGLFWARLASSIGIEERIRALDQGRFALPDGSERFLVDEAALLEHTARLGAILVDPIKTTNVQGLRCMTTWVLRKP